jgi:sarcosine oxidase / L-pipecolate oxidase
MAKTTAAVVVVTAAAAAVSEAKSEESNEQLADVQVLHTAKEVSLAASGGMPGYLGSCGSFGYLNRRSGWADAEATMIWLREKVTATNRVEFITGKVANLIFSADSKTVKGAALENGDIIMSDRTILAAGSWTPSLINLRGIVQCTAQPLAYIPVSHSEAARLAKIPVQLNLSNGLFIIPPPGDSLPGQDSQQPVYVKIARHFHGYLNPTVIPHPEPHLSDSTSSTITISVPCTAPHSTFPKSASIPLRDFARAILPKDISERPFAKTRLCHYADTPTGDFLIDYHPSYGKSLFVATGGSGHGYKFLPVMGEAITRCLIDTPTGTSKGIIDSNTMNSLRCKWAWRDPIKNEIWSTADGSRCGQQGLILTDEVNKSR